MSIEVDASQAFIGGVGAFGLPNTPASFVDSIRLTFGLANLAEMVAAAKAGRQMKGDVKGTLYVELMLPSMLGLPKGKADVVLHMQPVVKSITADPSTPQGLSARGSVQRFSVCRSSGSQPSGCTWIG